MHHHKRPGPRGPNTNRGKWGHKMADFPEPFAVEVDIAADYTVTGDETDLYQRVDRRQALAAKIRTALATVEGIQARTILIDGWSL